MSEGYQVRCGFDGEKMGIVAGVIGRGIHGILARDTKRGRILVGDEATGVLYVWRADDPGDSCSEQAPEHFRASMEAIKDLSLAAVAEYLLEHGWCAVE